MLSSSPELVVNNENKMCFFLKYNQMPLSGISGILFTMTSVVTSYVASYHRKPVKRVRVWDFLILRVHVKQIPSNNSSERLCLIQCALS